MLLDTGLAPKLETLNPLLRETITKLQAETERIEPDRLAILDGLAGLIAESATRRTDLLFVCTHNSRRSHVTMVWAAVAAHIYGFDQVETYSGGTAVTAFNMRAINALRRVGFEVEAPETPNPHVRVDFGPGLSANPCYSKLYDDPANPQADYVAIMTCAEADAECPYLPAARERVALRYRDPNYADDTAEEVAAYDHLVSTAGRELLYCFAEAKKLATR